MEPYIWRILLIDDDEDDYVLVREMLAESREGKFILEWASSLPAGEQALEAERSFDAVIVDYEMGRHKGTELIRAAVASKYPAPILLLTGQGTYATDVEAMEAGAADYLSKGDLNAVFLERSIRYAIERKKNELALQESEQRLRDSEQRFRALFENRHSVMWLVDPETGQIVDANEAACDFYGWSWEELLQMKVTDINTLPPGQTHMQMGRAKSSPTHVLFHFQHRLANGEIRDVEVRSGPVQIGERRLLFSIIFDISEHMRTQEALRQHESSLRESEAQLRDMADHLRIAIQAVNLGIWSVDLEGEEFITDEATKRMHGLAPDEEVVGWEDASRHIHPDDRDAVEETFHKARETGIFDTEYRVLLPSDPGGVASTGAVASFGGIASTGGVHWIYSFGGLDADRSHIHGVVMDITGRRQAEEALRQSEARFHTALSSLPMTVFTLDPELRYTWVYNLQPNLHPEQVVGKRQDELRSPEQMAEIMGSMRWVCREKQKLQKELQFEVNGAPVSYILTLEPVLDGHGELEYIVGAALDVTEQRKIEARHREYTTKMEVQGRLLEQREMERKQIARILHDGPLQGLIGLMYAMQFTQDSVKDSDLSQKLAQLSDEAKQLVGELRNLCYELQPPAVARFGIKRSIESYITDFQQVYPLKIYADLPESDCDIPEHMSLTLYRIFQEGLRNILLHANADTVHIHLYQEGNYLALKIQDNGAGFVVPENWVEFARQGRFGFVGMNERIEAIGGTLEVFSEPGQGTAVQVTVPCGEL